MDTHGSDTALHAPVNPVRFVTAANLFDGHDAAINIMRRLLQRQGAEVVHLGHNRSVEEVVTAAVQEDVQAVAISSYQGGHVEYFSYLVERLAGAGRPDVRVYGGGGGVIVSAEIDLLHRGGVARVFSPQDGQAMGLDRMVNTMIAESDRPLGAATVDLEAVVAGDQATLARCMTSVDTGVLCDDALSALRRAGAAGHAAVLGVTGTGRSGKSSLTDELVRRARLDQQDKLRIAVVAVDPTRRKGGGALLGDRIRRTRSTPSGSTSARSPRAARPPSFQPAWAMSSQRAGQRATTSSWWRPLVSARATPEWSRSWMSRFTSKDSKSAPLRHATAAIMQSIIPRGVTPARRHLR